jgi:hypothetical protein
LSIKISRQLGINVMTNWVEWVKGQLASSGEGFVWAFQQIEPELHHKIPPAPRLGYWSPARLVWHVTEYERCVAMPSMRQWLGDPIPGDDIWPDDDDTWAANQDRPSAELIESFQTVRAEQITLLDNLAALDWSAPAETVWGMKPLSMVVTKTFQHTFEHGDTLLRLALWWRDVEARLAQEAQSASKNAS